MTQYQLQSQCCTVKDDETAPLPAEPSISTRATQALQTGKQSLIFPKCTFHSSFLPRRAACLPPSPQTQSSGVCSPLRQRPPQANSRPFLLTPPAIEHSNTTFPRKTSTQPPPFISITLGLAWMTKQIPNTYSSLLCPSANCHFFNNITSDFLKCKSQSSTLLT